MATITVYSLYISIGEYIKTGRVVIGEVLVNTEFPFHGLSKLVTYLMIVSVVGWYCVTKIGAEKVKSISPSVKSILQLIVLAIACRYRSMNSFITSSYGVLSLQPMQ